MSSRPAFKSLRSAQSLILILLVLVAGGGLSSFPFLDQQADTHLAKDGLLDLSGEHKADPDGYHLKGNWEFYPGVYTLDFARTPAAHLKVPGRWNDLIIGGKPHGPYGYGTLRLTVTLPPFYRDRNLGLVVPEEGTAYRIYVNGTLKDSAGTPGVDASSTIPARRRKLISLEHFEGNHMEVVFHLANFHHRSGGIWNEPLLGPLKVLELRENKETSLDLFIVGGLFVMALYHLGLYFYVRMGLSPLILGLLFLIGGLRILVTGQMLMVNLFPDMGWGIQLRLEYLTGYLGPVFYLVFNEYLFGGPRKNRNIGIIFSVTLLFVGIILFFPSKVYTESLLPFQALTVMAIPYVFMLILKANMKKERYAIFALLGGLFVVVPYLNDILYSQGWIHTQYLARTGLYIFLFLQGMILVSLFAFTYRQAEAVGKDLEGQVVLQTAQLKDETGRKRQLIHLISHDMKNLVALIVGASRMLQSEEPEQMELARMIRNNADIAMGILTDVNNLEALESDKTEIRLSDTLLKECVESALDICHDMINEKRIETRLDIGESIYVSVDVHLFISTVLANIISNAVKFSLEGQVVDIFAKSEGDIVEITIRDQGVGIPPRMLANIFDPTQRTTRRGTAGETGTGFGVPLVKRFIEAMGGRVRIESKTGGGYWERGTSVILEVAAGKSPQDYAEADAE